MNPPAHRVADLCEIAACQAREELGQNHQFLGSKSGLFKIATASPAWAKTNNP
jgi:hypothetical protein